MSVATACVTRNSTRLSVSWRLQARHLSRHHVTREQAPIVTAGPMLSWKYINYIFQISATIESY